MSFIVEECLFAVKVNCFKLLFKTCPAFSQHGVERRQQLNCSFTAFRFELILQETVYLVYPLFVIVSPISVISGHFEINRNRFITYTETNALSSSKMSALQLRNSHTALVIRIGTGQPKLLTVKVYFKFIVIFAQQLYCTRYAKTRYHFFNKYPRYKYILSFHIATSLFFSFLACSLECTSMCWYKAVHCGQ